MKSLVLENIFKVQYFTSFHIMHSMHFIIYLSLLFCTSFLKGHVKTFVKSYILSFLCGCTEAKLIEKLQFYFTNLYINMLFYISYKNVYRSSSFWNKSHYLAPLLIRFFCENLKYSLSTIYIKMHLRRIKCIILII